MIKRLFELCGSLEKLAKVLAYSDKLPRERLKRIYHKLFLKKGVKTEVDENLMERIFEWIDSLGIKKGDILIVHSSMEGLRKAAPDPKRIIDYLLQLVGEEGTLVIPTFPVINLKYDNKSFISFLL